jgi:signal transduction histidine kinase
MMVLGEAVGRLVACDRAERPDAFTQQDERLLHAFAATAAEAVTMAHSVENNRRRGTPAADEVDRARWARVLHDETMQRLSTLLAAALKTTDPDASEETMLKAIERPNARPPSCAPSSPTCIAPRRMSSVLHQR